MNIQTMNINELTIHELADMNPLMTSTNFNALQLDIEANGQKVPVTVFRNKIVDGRHRYTALSNLNIDTILVEILPNNTTLDSIKRNIMSLENRRHQTPTQLAIKAYRAIQSGVKNKDAVAAVGCSSTNVKYVVSLGKLKRFDLIGLLESGHKIKNHNGKMTDNLMMVQQCCRQNPIWDQSEIYQNRYHLYCLIHC